MEAKHTPGPWRDCTQTNTPSGQLWIENAEPSTNPDQNGTEIICSVHGPDRIANANLIAAAPDLLEAADDMLHSYRTPDHRGVVGAGRANRLETVIAKARGQ